MSIPKEPTPVQLFFAVLAAPKAPVEQLRRILEQQYSSIALEMPPHRFSQSAYYEPEMGQNLEKSIWFCEDLIDPSELLGVKLHTNNLENEFAGEQGRVLNIDPGYMHLARVVLATGKDNSHRIYVGKGIYEEITLLYRKNHGFEPLSWTYPDYRNTEVIDFLNQTREALLNRMRNQEGEWRSI